MDNEYEPFDFVYCGKRRSSNGKMCIELRLLSEEISGEVHLLDPRWYSHAKTFERAIGYIYSGATFTKQEVKGLAKASATGQKWHNQQDVLDWIALDTAAEVEKRAATMEANRKKSNEIDDLLLPLRQVYHGYWKRGDRIGMQALEQAVVMALKKRP